MVTVTTDDVAGVLMYHLAPLGAFVPELPAGCGYDNKESQFVAGVHERRILRIVGCADDGHAGIFQPHDIAPLLGIGHGIAHVGEVLMTIATHQLVIGLTVEPESVFPSELCLTDTHTDHTAIEALLAIHHL